MSSKTDFNGKTTAYGYDATNRLLSKTPDASFSATPVSFTYTASGKRQTMTDPSGVTTYTYDPQTDRLTSKQTPFGTISYTYDAAGNVTAIASSNANGAAMAYQYDKLNRLSTVTVAGQLQQIHAATHPGAKIEPKKPAAKPSGERSVEQLKADLLAALDAEAEEE